MSSFKIYPLGKVTLTIAANESVAVYSKGDVNVYRTIGTANHPDQTSLLGTILGQAAGGAQTVYGPYASGATIIIEATADDVYYETGVAPVVQYGSKVQGIQADPVALNATGSITAAAILGGILTSTTAAAVAGTLPTGTVMDAASEFAIGDSVDWSIINTGGNTFTVTAATGHTIVGTATVVTVVSGRFRTRKTAANTFITYCLA